MADTDSTKTTRQDALDSLLMAVKAVSEQAITVTEDGMGANSSASCARDLALAYRYILGGIQPGSAVASDK